MNSLEESLPQKTASSSNKMDNMVETVSKQADSVAGTVAYTSPSFDWKIILIAVLIILLVLMYLGINFFNIFGDSLQSIVNITRPTLSKIVGAFGYTTGETINQTADVASDSIKMGVDVAEGVVQNVGNLLIDASEEADPSNRLRTDLEEAREKTYNNEPSIDSTDNPIQNPITSGKQNWCLVGEYQNKRGCVPVTESDKCLSGQVFPNQQMCLNPTLTPQ